MSDVLAEICAKKREHIALQKTRRPESYLLSAAKHITPPRGFKRKLAAKKPILMIFEDIHWIDPTTQELLEIFVQRIEQMPILLVASFRPDFTASWADQPHVTLMLKSLVTIPAIGFFISAPCA